MLSALRNNIDVLASSTQPCINQNILRGWSAEEKNDALGMFSIRAFSRRDTAEHGASRSALGNGMRIKGNEGDEEVLLSKQRDDG